MSDLVSMLALPAVWSEQEPRQIVTTFHDALMAALNLDFLYTRVSIQANVEPIEVLKTAPHYATTQNRDTIRRALNERFGDDPRRWPAEVRSYLDEQETSLLSMRLGVEGEIGIVVAGSRRADFPTQAERLLLGVAANQAAVGLQQARLLSEQKRIADELELRVAERTATLAETNQELRKEIAERKVVEDHLLRSEGLLRTSEARLRQVIDTIPSLSWCNLPDGSNEFLSKGWHDYTGLSPQEARGWGWQAAFHPEDLPTLMKRWRELLISGEPGEIEARLRRHDGMYRWFLIKVAPLHDEMGKIVRWYGTSTDINDRKLAEEALQSSECTLLSIINTIPATAWSTRPDGYCDFLNRRWLEYAGMTAEEAQGWGWGAAIYPDDRAALVDCWQSCLASGTPLDTEARMRRFDGSYRWFLFRADPLRDESGSIVKWYGTNTDIDDRKRAEEESRRSEARKTAILDSALDGIVTIDHEGCITEFNPAAERTFGYGRNEVMGKRLSEVMIPPSLRQQHRQGLARYQVTGEAQFLGKRVELTAVRADGTEFPVELAISRIPMDGAAVFCRVPPRHHGSQAGRAGITAQRGIPCGGPTPQQDRQFLLARGDRRDTLVTAGLSNLRA
jgi:PAS domain S-box-containing protein